MLKKTFVIFSFILDLFCLLKFQILFCPVSWDCRICRLHFCKEVRIYSIRINVCMCIWSSSSSSCADSTDSLDSLSLFLAIHPYRSLLLPGPLHNVQCPCSADQCKSLLVGWHWSNSPLENNTYEFIPASLAVPTISCSSYLDSVWDGRSVAAQLFSGVLVILLVFIYPISWMWYKVNF